MVGLHALKTLDEHATALHIVVLLLGGNGSLDGATWPESVAHRTPRVRGVRAKVGSTVLADDEARGVAGEGDVDQAVFIDGRFEGVGIALLVESQGNVVGPKGKHALVEHEVVQGIGVPAVRAISLGIEDLAVELRSRVNASGERFRLEESKFHNDYRMEKLQADGTHTMLL